MSASQRAVMFCGWGVKAGMACLQVKLCDPCLSAFEALCVKMRYTNRRILLPLLTNVWDGYLFVDCTNGLAYPTGCTRFYRDAFWGKFPLQKNANFPQRFNTTTSSSVPHQTETT